MRQYRTQANFYVIVQNDTEEELHKDLDVTVVTDDGRIAEACGVYATLQAVILNADRTLYYRGNYNKILHYPNHSLRRTGFTTSYRSAIVTINCKAGRATARM